VKAAPPEKLLNCMLRLLYVMLGPPIFFCAVIVMYPVSGDLVEQQVHGELLVSVSLAQSSNGHFARKTTEVTEATQAIFPRVLGQRR
jgi:hypothetical protein